MLLVCGVRSALHGSEGNYCRKYLNVNIFRRDRSTQQETIFFHNKNIKILKQNIQKRNLAKAKKKSLEAHIYVAVLPQKLRSLFSKLRKYMPTKSYLSTSEQWSNMVCGEYQECRQAVRKQNVRRASRDL
ncbi:unnamed protein product [Ceratitis capitata]|uniref:(Mediterranean fruit fly) hypothetical protein n=1 Tax=Ceratitis capitata TaxID=7213 RepID=A0A811U949_CERCA|nr:unnamed protein product [Ceratitis capitata]